MSSTANNSNSPVGDPFTQTFSLHDSTGEEYTLSIDDLTLYAQYGIRIGINWGSQIGASAILLVLLMILTKHEKRRSPIFILNALSLVFGVIRAVLNCLYYTGAWYNPYAFFSQDYSRVSTIEYGNSVAAEVMQLCLVICIEISLVLQVRVICISMGRIHKVWIMAVSALVATATVGVRFALTVINCQNILATLSMYSWRWLSSTANITTTVSICFFSLVFCSKLGLAIRNRRKLGLKQFGPMQIIFIMGAQTMIIPGIFSILQYRTNVPEFDTQVLTVVTIFLPLSSIWASISTGGRTQASRGHDAHHKLFGSFGWSKSSDRKVSTVSENNSTIPLNCPISPISARTMKTTETFNSDKTAVDLEAGNEHLFGINTCTTIDEKTEN